MNKYKAFMAVITTLALNVALAQKQGQERIDSLLAALSNAKEDTEKVKIFTGLNYNYNLIDPDKAIAFGNQGLALAQKLDWKKGIANCYNNIGVGYHEKSEYYEALKYYQQSLDIKEQLGDKNGMQATLGNMGLVYTNFSDYPKALDYYQRSLRINEQLGNKNDMAIDVGNIGLVYDYLEDYPKALEYYQRALKLKEQAGNKKGMAITLGNIAMVYSTRSEYSKSLEYYQRSLHINEELGNKNGIARDVSNMGLAYVAIADYPKAFAHYEKALGIMRQLDNKSMMVNTFRSIGDWYQKAPDKAMKEMGLSPAAKYRMAEVYLDSSLQLSQELKTPDLEKDTWDSLKDLYEKQGNPVKAYEAYKNYILLRDSIQSGEVKDQITRKEMQYEFDKKEAAAKAEQEKKDIVQRNIFKSVAAAFAGALIFLVVVYRQRNKIARARKRSDELLLNILPREVADELKEKGRADAKDFDEVTVLFTDFKNFTHMSEKLSAQELVNEINYCYSSFDNIITRHGIEKIKTIGDAYMCAGGLPVPTSTNAEDTVRAAISILDFMIQEKQKREAQGGSFFELRIGIHTGPVVAGIVGIKKFAYDIWGDTVNIASRMESSGESGKINISGTTYERVKEKFKCTHRGKVKAKNKGEVDMYFVEAAL